MKPTPSLVDAAPTISSPISYAEAKEIALLRLELRACWERADTLAGCAIALRLTELAGNDNELRAEARRWIARFAV